jgi:predicted nucleic acid-binding protein
VTVVADTGALYALVDASDAWHARVTAWWRSNSSAIVVPITVIPEVCYLLNTRIGPAAELAFIEGVVADEFTVESSEPEDFVRAADVMTEYADFPLGFVDASIVAIAERLESRSILSTDRRHFSVVRPRHAKRFTLLP